MSRPPVLPITKPPLNLTIGNPNLKKFVTWKIEKSSVGRGEVTEIGQRISGDIKGMRPVEFSTNSRQICLDHQNLQLDMSDEQDQRIALALNQVPDTFAALLDREQDMFVKRFPGLFDKVKAKSNEVPSTITEVIENPDGSKTTRVKSRKSYSSTFSSHQTFVNGVKQMSKSKFRAFVEYQGPEGGFQVKLSDSDDLSEDELEDDDTKSQSCISEIDTDSEITGGSTSTKSGLDKRYQKAWYAAKELVDSEQRYVEKLRLLGDTFRNRLIKEEVITNDKITRLLANISSLYQFHNTHFLPQLMDSIREWQTTKRIANVVRKQAPFLKMYSEYTNNYDRASKLFEELKKKKKFADVVKEIEKQSECEGLPLGHHLICPVQRVMRYQLLLQEYKKHLQPDDADFEDSRLALELVLQAAAHANEMMKKLFRGSLGKHFDRFLVVRDDFCMYTYSSEEDTCALAMLPLPGCEVKICGEKFTFSVRVGARRMYTMTAEDEQTQMRWLAILDLAANNHLKNQRNSGSEQSE
uniref:DH domain-containing protein n=1 Tax=Caenorhabditis tropicalis TaxID=1561998 RepID=A0A1I7UTT1_9PELO